MLSKLYIGDQACENQPCERIQIAYFFHLCSVIAYNQFVQIQQNLYH